MPKVKYLQSKEEKQRERVETKSKALRGVIGNICYKYRLAQYEFAEQVGMNKATLCKRLKNPRDFTLDELCKIETAFPEFALTFDLCKNL